MCRFCHFPWTAILSCNCKNYTLYSVICAIENVALIFTETEVKWLCLKKSVTRLKENYKLWKKIYWTEEKIIWWLPQGNAEDFSFFLNWFFFSLLRYEFLIFFLGINLSFLFCQILPFLLFIQATFLIFLIKMFKCKMITQSG